MKKLEWAIHNFRGKRRFHASTSRNRAWPWKTESRHACLCTLSEMNDCWLVISQTLREWKCIVIVVKHSRSIVKVSQANGILRWILSRVEMHHEVNSTKTLSRNDIFTSFDLYYTKEHTFFSMYGEFLANPIINMAVRGLLRVTCRRLRRARPMRETQQSQFCVYTFIFQLFTNRFSKFFHHKIACTFLSLLTKFDANRT